MTDGTNPPDLSAAAKEKAQELRHAVRELGRNDRLVFLCSSACLVLWLFNWFSMETFMGSQGKSGMHDKFLIGWFACLATVLLSLVKMNLVPAEGAKSLARNPLVYLVLTIVTFVFGPFLFLIESNDVPELAREIAKAGKTLFFWLAFGASLAALAGAAFNFLQARKSGAGTTTPAP